MDADLARLSVVIDAKMNRLEEKLNNAVRASYGAANKMERAFNKANMGKAVSAQFDGIASSTRAGALGIEAFGAAAAPVAVGVAGVAVAVQGMRMALQFGDDLDAMATKIGVTAESLQELRFAANDADIASADFDKSLQGLNNAIGAYKTGVGDARVKKAFEALGLTPADLAGVRNAADFIPLLADRIAKLQTTAERVKIAKALGAEEMVPLLERGSDAIAEQTQRARDLGIVMSDDLTKSAADANRELEVMWNIITSKTNVALANMGVWAVKTAQDLQPLIDRLADFLNLSKDSREAYLKQEIALADQSATNRAGSLNPAFRGQAQGYRDRAAQLRRELADLQRPPSAAPQPRAPAPPASAGGGSGGGGGSSPSRVRSAGRARFSGPLPDYIREAIAAGRFTEASVRETYPDGNFPLPDFVAAGELQTIDPSTTWSASDIDTPIRVDQNPDLGAAAPEVVGSGRWMMSPEEARRVEEQWASTIGGGLRAAIYGGADEVAMYFAQTLTDALIDNLATDLASFLRQGLGGGGSGGGAGGGGGWLASAASALFGGGGSGGGFGFNLASIFGGGAGGRPGIGVSGSPAVFSPPINGNPFAGMFAAGGTIPRGQWGIVGEAGAEAVRAGPNGIEVKPNSALRALTMPAMPTAVSAGGGARARLAPTTVNVNINLDGAKGDDVIRTIARQETAEGLRQGLRAAARAQPDQQLKLATLGYAG